MENSNFRCGATEITPQEMWSNFELSTALLWIVWTKRSPQVLSVDSTKNCGVNVNINTEGIFGVASTAAGYTLGIIAKCRLQVIIGGDMHMVELQELLIVIGKDLQC